MVVSLKTNQYSLYARSVSLLGLMYDEKIMVIKNNKSFLHLSAIEFTDLSYGVNDWWELHVSESKSENDESS